MSVATRFPPELRAKLAPLLRLQSSNNDGERANASAAIGRLLKNNGLDWHDLTEVLLAEPVTTQPAAPAARPAAAWKRSHGAVDLRRDQLLELIDLIEAGSDFLSPRSNGFIGSLRTRAGRFREVHLSEKQWKWLQDLIEEAGY